MYLKAVFIFFQKSPLMCRPSQKKYAKKQLQKMRPLEKFDFQLNTMNKNLTKIKFHKWARFDASIL
jgi:hypothetical protein